MAIVESVVSFLVERLGDQLIREVSLLRDERNQIEWVRREFRRMECFLKDMDTAGVEENERMTNWRQEVRDSAYRAEDIVDIFLLEIAPLRRQGYLGTVERYAFIFKELMARRRLLSKIETLKIDLESMTTSRARYHFESMGDGEAKSGSTSRSLREKRLAFPNDEEPDFTGFDEDVRKLIQRLTQGDTRRCVIGVVGMAGLGKTTIAKVVYNNDVVQKHFDLCRWIPVSQVYSVRKLFLALIGSWVPEKESKVGSNENELAETIAKYLRTRRYLMVLDDMWKTDDWEALKAAIPDGATGSRVLLTTRNEVVALHAGSYGDPHRLEPLTQPESWELFCKKAFPGNASRPNETTVLEDIVKRCRGLPLAIVVIGGLLSRKEPREWENVYKSLSWQFVEGEVQIAGILSLSYQDLPYDLKPCFLYLGNFPEDYEFSAKKLVNLWAAEGFIRQRGAETVEKVGEDCLKELIQRSLVQVARTSTTGAVKSCRIHDLFREVCVSQGKKEKFLEIDDGDVTSAAAPFSPFTARRLAIHQGDSLVQSTQNLRSILIYGGTHEWLGGGEKKPLSRSLKLLLVLDINEVTLGNLPSEIGELIHLRYLACSLHFRESISLPSSIGNLTNLQALFFLTSGGEYLKITSTIVKMKQLRHLRVQGHSLGVVGGQPRLHHLSRNLCTLSGVSAGKWLFDNKLGEMRNLRKLGIYILPGEADVEEVWKSIVKLESLESLFASSVKPPSSSENSLPLRLVPLDDLRRLSKLHLLGKLEKLPESSHLPLNLTKLTLTLSHLERDPLPMLGKLQNLQVLKLGESSYLGKVMACPAGWFRQLKSLNLEALHNLEDWIVEEESMPDLSYLGIAACEKLKMIPEGLQHVTSLKTLEMRDMQMKFYTRVERDKGADWPKIQRIPSVITHQIVPPLMYQYYPLYEYEPVFSYKNPNACNIM